jgi:aldehyde dehydrogenase (NAD+)
MESIPTIIEKQRRFFASNKTKEYSFRIEQLKKLKEAILQQEEQIQKALLLDLNKSKEEAYLTEIGIVISEIDFHLKHLKKWMKLKKVKTPLFLQPSKSHIQYEPLGVALIISPWNYPFQLVFSPLIGVISAGCCAVIKPSPEASNTEKLMAEMVRTLFPEEYIAMVTGGVETANALLSHRFDILFFTGSTRVGKIVMQAAAQHLTPVVLELGGKSPCIVDKDANLALSAKRIAWGKLMNAGQTCIAPDYIYVHSSVKREFITLFKEQLQAFWDKKQESHLFYGKIITESSLKRLTTYLDELNIKDYTVDEQVLQPIVVENPTLESQLMQNELFGPIMPILTFTSIDEVIATIQQEEKPLALYYFGIKNAQKVQKNTSSGSFSHNDTIMHIANPYLPFGGVGASGMGSYHGEYSFKAFSHSKSIFYTPTWIDLPFKYPPFKWFKMVKKLL